MKHWIQRGAVSLIGGFICTILIMYFSQVDFANTRNGPMHYMVFQSIALSTIFLALYLSIKFIKEIFRTKLPFTTTDTCIR